MILIRETKCYQTGKNWQGTRHANCFNTSMEDQVQGPLIPELESILPEAFKARIKRPGIVNAMHHPGFNKAVKATGRKKMFVAGITTEICVTFPVLQMLDEGYDMQVSADARLQIQILVINLLWSGRGKPGRSSQQ